MSTEEEGASPADFLTVFDGSPSGQRVLQELLALFNDPPYQPGGHEAERETLRRIGHNEVVHHILRRMQQA